MAKVLNKFIIIRNSIENKNISLVFGPQFLKFLPTQNQLEETIRLDEFIDKATTSGMFKHKNVNISFLNYGRTQIVLLAEIDKDKQYTLVVNQPAVPYGTGRKEYDNLKQLNVVDTELVIKPITYVTNQKQELYITPYYHQARCIGVDTTEWGVWVPEPNYHFKKFTEHERKIVNVSMVAALVKLYDTEKQIGIVKCRLDGGDFMLLKGYEDCPLTYQNLNQHLKLIAARELSHMSIETYLGRLKQELSNNNLKESELMIIGRTLRQPLTAEEIDIGIELGLNSKRKEKASIQNTIERSM